MALGASQAARFQAYQTRARISVVLWFRIIICASLVWAALTLYVVWRQTAAAFPALGHQFFWYWVICGTMIETPLVSFYAARISVPVAGQWYPLPQFLDWLNGPQLYHLPFTVWFAHYALRTALVPVAIGVAIISWRVRKGLDGEHLRGLRLLTPRDHNHQLEGEDYRARLLACLNRPSGGSGIRIGSSIIPVEKECEHFQIAGSPGSGKSTQIRHMLYQIQERGQAAIVVDPDAEFVQEFYKPERGDVVLNPLDERCPYWSPWSELRDGWWFTVDAAATAASLIRGKPRDDNQRFFLESTRTVIEAILHVVDARGDAAGLLEFVSFPRDQIHKRLEGTPAYPLIDPGAAEQGAGILATAVNAIKTFIYLPTAEQAAAKWSAREWADTRKGWIFLPAREDIRDSIQLLQGLWLDCLVRWLMSAEIGSDQVWIVADELPALSYQPQIEKLVTRGRKRGLAVVMGFQNVSQLRAIYGAEGAITLTSSPTSKIILRVDETETAKWASDLIGAREVERLRMTQLAGLSSYREGVNLQAERKIEHLVLPAEIQMLEPLRGYLCVAGHDRTRIRIPERHLNNHHPAFIPRISERVDPKPQQPQLELRSWHTT